MRVKYCFLFFQMVFIMVFLTNCTEDLDETPTFSGHLFGFVTTSGEGLQDVLVTVQSGNVSLQATTNAQGRYQIKQLEAGEYTVNFSKQSYIGSSVKIDVLGSIANEKSLSLEPGMGEISVATTSINASVVDGEYFLPVESNANWIATASDSWLKVQQDSKIGKGSIRVLWNSNEEGKENRTADIKITAGDVEKVIQVFQARATKILSVRGSVGEMISGSRSQIRIQFDGYVDVKRITPLFTNCMGEISEPSYNANRDLATFTYSCGGLGFSYPFHIEWEDQYGNRFIGEFRADFFAKILKIPGMIVSRFNLPGEDKQWVLTQSPNKIYQVDLATLSILREFPWTPTSHFESYITINPYNHQLYVGGRSQIAVIDPNTGVVKERISLPSVPSRPESAYRVVDFAFKNDGIGVFVAMEVDTGGTDWFMIDSSDGHRIFAHPQKGWDEDKYHRVESLMTSQDQKSLYMYASGFNTFDFMSLGNFVATLTSVQAFEGKPSLNQVVYNRVKNNILFVHQSDFSVLENTTLFDWGHVANIVSADFAYHGDFVSHFYGIEEYGNLFLFDYRKGEIVKKFNRAGASWRNIAVTLDGEYLIAETHNSDDYAPEGQFITNLNQYPTSLFR